MRSTYLEALSELGIGGAHPGGLQLTKKVIDQLRINKNSSVLDAGCGTGQSTAYLAENYQCKIYCIDNSQVMVEKANQRFSLLQLPIRAELGSVDNMDYDTSVFDIVLSESVLVFTTIPITLLEFKRVLKPEGSLIAVEMTLEKPLSKDEMYEINEFYGISQILTEEEWQDEFIKAGFKKISIQSHNYNPAEINLDNAPDFILSEDMDDLYFKELETHELLTKKYKDKLGFRVFICS